MQLPEDFDIERYADARLVEAEKVTRACRVYEAWESIGATVNPVGSTAMGLLCKHRDIDFHVYTDKLDIADSFRAILQICTDKNATRLECRNLSETEECCLEWHVWYTLDSEEWQIDMIQILKGSTFDGYFERIAARIREVLTPETRRTILQLKYQTPETEHIAGIEYYQAVLADNVRTYAEFEEWRREHPLTGICTWCP
ncbi:MAG: phosphoglycerate mutase family protein [Planctomycetia bacterium]|nr:phosphoglycerate mutase family protein [Planctomycetia bacterium]